MGWQTVELMPEYDGMYGESRRRRLNPADWTDKSVKVRANMTQHSGFPFYRKLRKGKYLEVLEDLGDIVRIPHNGFIYRVDKKMVATRADGQSLVTKHELY